MQRREKILIIGLVAVLAVWRGGPIVQRILFGGLKEKREQLRSIDSQIQQKELQQAQLIRNTARLKAWRDSSLPPDPRDAQRLYQQWITELALLSGWEHPRVVPGRVADQGNVFSGVQVQVDARPSFDQLLAFLYHFHRTNLLHRVVQLNVVRRGSEDALDVSLIAEGVAMRDALRRPTLLPATKLEQDVSPRATTLTVEKLDPIPPTPFVVRMDTELARVMKVEENQWTVERGVEGTRSGQHASGQVVELVPLAAELASASLADYRSKFDGGLFRPFRNQPPRLAAIRPQDAYFGRTLTFTARARDGAGEPGSFRFRLRGAPNGAEIDPETGEFRWTPDPSLSPRRYEFEIEVSDGGSPPQTASQRVAVQLHEDPAKSTFLVASVAMDEDSEAWLHDSRQNQKMALHKGDTFRIADISGTVVEITDDYMLIRGEDGSTYRLRLGDNLRDMQLVTSAEAPPES